MQDNFNSSADGSTPASRRAEMVLRDFGLAFERRDNGILIARGEFDMSELGWSQLPDLSMVDLEGDFICRENSLTSLAGLPRSITGVIDCRDNPDLVVLGDVPGTGKIISDQGTFNSRRELPPELQVTAKEHMGSVAATVLRKPVKVGSALSFRKKS